MSPAQYLLFVTVQVLLNGDAGARLLQIPRASMLRQRRVLPGKLVLPRRTTALDEWGVPWAAPVVQGYSGERFLGMPYIEDSASRDVLETVNEERRSSENRYGYIKTYGQNVNWVWPQPSALVLFSLSESAEASAPASVSKPPSMHRCNFRVRGSDGEMIMLNRCTEETWIPHSTTMKTGLRTQRMTILRGHMLICWDTERFL